MQKRSLKANCSPSSRYVVCSATFLESPIDAITFGLFTTEIGISVSRQVPVYVKSGHASRLRIFRRLQLEILDKT